MQLAARHPDAATYKATGPVTATVVNRRRLTPKHPRGSARCRAGRRPICALKNIHPTSGSLWRAGASDISTHRILSDLSAFIGHEDPSKHRILAAGDLNMIYGATGRTLSLPERQLTVWDRFEALGLEFLGPQAPNGHQASVAPPDVPAETKNVPTFYPIGKSAAAGMVRLDYTSASSGVHERVKVRALNEVDEWGSSDHCRLRIEVDTG